MANILTADPARDGESITPSDTGVISPVARGLYVGGAGNVKVDMVGGTALTFSGVAAGTVLPIQVTRVYSTGTTATPSRGSCSRRR